MNDKTMETIWQHPIAIVNAGVESQLGYQFWHN